MELDQILKRVQWMDDERRKDKDTIAKLENRIIALEGNIDASHQQIRDLNAEITRLSTVTSRIDNFENVMIQQRLEAKKQVEELDKETRKREEEAIKLRRVEMKALDSSLFEFRNELDTISKLEKGLLLRVEEDNRLSRGIEELSSKIDLVAHSEEEYLRTYRLIEDGRRQDTKRINDLTGEVTAMRKRVDDQRSQTELVNNSLRKVEARLSELLEEERERRDKQAAFLDKQALLQVERDRTWKDWQTRFEVIEKQAIDIESQLQKLDITHRDAKRAQQSLDDLTQRVERRIGEITEIQRLTEDRFRQEWITFKADDQKRWTNYTLASEEQRNETQRSYDKIHERVTQLEDMLQEEHDLLEQMHEQSEKRLQSLLAMAHEWVSAYERALGHAR
jgi:chromosome segregation ATPase